jgi:hypothetical protein
MVTGLAVSSPPSSSSPSPPSSLGGGGVKVTPGRVLLGPEPPPKVGPSSAWPKSSDEESVDAKPPLAANEGELAMGEMGTAAAVAFSGTSGTLRTGSGAAVVVSTRSPDQVGSNSMATAHNATMA